MNMKIYLPLIVLTLAALACSLPSVGVPGASGPTPGGAQPLPGDSVPAAQATGIGTLSLRILSPLDGAVVTSSIVEIVGEAPAGAIISIGDDILIVGTNGKFKHVVSLEEGPNLIEILASDANGHEAYILLGIFYEPQ